MAGAGKQRRRSRPPHRPYRCDTSRRLVRNRSALLEAINGFYAAALDRLPVDEMPALVPRLLKAGLCVGFSDPVSTIVVNTVSSYSRRAPERKPAAVTMTPPAPASGSDEEGENKRKAAAERRRRRALSRAVADTGAGVTYCSPFRRLLRDMPVAARSLEALVAFLACYFRYLSVPEALEYLWLAGADAIAAARLISEDRGHCSGGRNGFSLASRTTRTALKCAALAAWHPKPRALVKRSYSFASRMEQVSQIILAAEGGGGGSLSCAAVETISGLLQRRRKLKNLAGIAPPRFFPELSRPPPYVPTKSLRSVLLDRVYGMYMDALARLPAAGLRRRYHRGVLKAGHCFGPFRDPVSNIVLNTVWYETAMFPPEEVEELAVAMVCSRSLVLVACRSLRGIVAYLRACFDTVSEHHAMRYLLFAEVDLWGAIEMARGEGHADRSVGQENAYMAAATAAMHPDPEAMVNFLVSRFPGLPISMQTEPMALDVQLLSQMLMQYCSTPPHGSVQIVPELSEGGSKVLSCIQSDFEKEERFVIAKVNAALKKYTQQSGGPAYELHVICGLNRNVDNSFARGLHYGPGHMRPRKTQYSHINFLASPTDLHSTDTVPILFFAECSNNEDVNDESWCWPVMGRHPGMISFQFLCISTCIHFRFRVPWGMLCSKST